MDCAAFAEFWRLQGHRVLSTPSCYWYSGYPFFYLSLPFHRAVSPARREILHVLLRGPSLAVRFPTHPNGEDARGGVFLCTDRGYDLASLHQKARNQTRRALERCRVELVTFDYLAEHGHALNEQTFVRQGRSPLTITHERWRRYCEAAGSIPGFEAWAAFVDGSLAAFAVTALVDDCLSILHQSSATEHLRDCPNNALVFTVTRRALVEEGVGAVSYGLRSVDDTDGLNHFKIRMGFQLVPRTDRVVVNPILKPLLALGGRQGLVAMARRHPESDFWRKAANTATRLMGTQHA